MTQAAKMKELTKSTIAFKAVNHYKDQFLPIVADSEGWQWMYVPPAVVPLQKGEFPKQPGKGWPV